jgi:hypothetical protein
MLGVDAGLAASETGGVAPGFQLFENFTHVASRHFRFERNEYARDQ